jgi:4-amino-4-deoxy-L-arabinose transferase-like glycosyltransferase
MTRVPFTQNYRWHLPLLLLVFCCSFFINNGAIFADIMESRNIITAREMVYDHNWLVPTMNGELRLEKPPLPTWIAAITEMISPDNLPLQRAMAGFAAVMLVLFFYKFATKLTGNRTYALVSSLVLCTSYNIILMGRTATWDIYCHAFMMGAIYYLYLALRQNPCKWTYFIGAGIFMGLSFLGKGPVSFYALLLPFVCAYILYYRKETQMKGKWIALAVMILIGIVLSTWWYAYIYIYHQEMASYVFHKESSSWSNHNVRSWYYYWQFFLETGVWSLLTLTTLLVPFWKKRVESSKEYLFCLSWMLLILFFLSLLPEKKTRYLLPILLPAALTMGHLFVYWIRQAKQKMPQLKDRVLYRINAYLIVVAALALPIALYLFMYREGRMGTGMFVWLVVLFLTVAVWLFDLLSNFSPFPS